MRHMGNANVQLHVINGITVTNVVETSAVRIISITLIQLTLELLLSAQNVIAILFLHADEYISNIYQIDTLPKL